MGGRGIVFEEKKEWSEELRKKVESYVKDYFLSEGFVVSDSQITNLVGLIDLALEQGNEEGYEQARENVGDWYEPEPPAWYGDEP